MNYLKVLTVITGLLFVIDIIDAFHCLSCKGVAKMADCKAFKECSASEHCHARKYYSGISLLYDLDCKSIQECRLQEQTRDVADGFEVDMWTGCCGNENCNAKFDDNGHLKQLGMTCYSCTGISDPADCQKTTTCKVGEVCITDEKFTDSGASIFDMGCLSRKICVNLGYYLHLKKRHSKRKEECRGCCDSSDRCNNKFCSKKNSQGAVTLVGSSAAATPAATPAATTAPVTMASTTPTTMTTDSTITIPSTTPASTTIQSSTTVVNDFSKYHLVVEPGTLTPKAGTDAKFVCKFNPEMHRNITISWSFDSLTGKEIPIFKEETNPPRLEYLISNVLKNDSGIYTCKAMFETHTWSASGTLIVS